MDNANKGTIHHSTFEDETRRLKVENQYMRWILETLHKNITDRDAEPQMKSKPPEALMNDQPLVDLTTNIWKATHKLYNMEMELDYTYRRISQLSTMIVGGEGSEVTPSPMKNIKFTTTGRKPRSNPAQTAEQSEQSLKLEKDLELITSALMDMKKKERQFQEELSSKEVIIMQLIDKIDRNVLTRRSHLPDAQTRIEVAEDNLREQKNVNAKMAEKLEITEKALEQKTEDLCELKNVNAKMAKKLEITEKALEQKTEDLRELKNVNAKMAKRLEITEKALEQKTEDLRELKNVNAKMAKKWEITEKALEQKTEEYIKLEAAEAELDSEHETLKQIYNETYKQNQKLEIIQKKQDLDVSSLKHEVFILQQREINQEHQIQQLNDEKERLLTRLSMIAGDRLTHVNVNLADLSDVDRPTRLSEVYSELYDNEWTDAFEELTSEDLLSEKKAIQFLLEILMNAFQKCRQITWDRYEAMKSVTVTLDITHRINSSSTNKRQERKKVPSPVESTSHHSPKVTELDHQPPSGPSEEQYLQQQQRISVEPMETEVYETIWSSETAPDYQESSNKSIGRQDLKQAGKLDVSRLHAVPTSGQSRSKDKKDACCIAEERKDSRGGATVQLSLSVDQENDIKTSWKTMSNAMKVQALELLRSVLITGFEINEKDMPKLSRYLVHCVEICWRMGLQEKPLHLDIEAEEEHGSERVFDANKFRAYTKTGKKVDYIVWPALFIHEGGAILSKGIAQGC